MHILSASKQETGRRARYKLQAPPPIGSLPLLLNTPFPTVPPAGEPTIQTGADGDTLCSHKGACSFCIYTRAHALQPLAHSMWAEHPKESRHSCEKNLTIVLICQLGSLSAFLCVSEDTSPKKATDNGSISKTAQRM